jgi:predicted DNA-binding transcriptional regulator AlpA
MAYYSNSTVSATNWIPLVEYAHKKGISLSTLRRHIKSGKIPYKVDQGRYLLFDDSDNKTAVAPKASLSLESLQLELQQAREEVAELKTLIAFYEEKNHHQPRRDV